MTCLEREYLVKRIVPHYVNIADRQKKITVNHFLQERIPHPTIYWIIKKFEESSVIGDKPKSSRPDKLSKQKLTRLKRLTDQNTGISLRKIAPKFDVDKSAFESYGCNISKKKRTPKYTDKQLEEVPRRTLSNGDG